MNRFWITEIFRCAGPTDGEDGPSHVVVEMDDDLFSQLQAGADFLYSANRLDWAGVDLNVGRNAFGLGTSEPGLEALSIRVSKTHITLHGGLDDDGEVMSARVAPFPEMESFFESGKMVLSELSLDDASELLADLGDKGLEIREAMASDIAAQSLSGLAPRANDQQNKRPGL